MAEGREATEPVVSHGLITDESYLTDAERVGRTQLGPAGRETTGRMSSSAADDIHDERVWEVLANDPAAEGYDRRDDDEQPCTLPACRQPTTLRFQHPTWGPVPLCASCWDTDIHGGAPDA